MSRCVDEKNGALLHAYELGLLDQELEESFERHLLECSFCWEELERNRETMQLIDHSPAVREVINRAAGVEERLSRTAVDAPPSRWAPSRLALYAAAALIVIMIYPAYLGLSGRQAVPVRPIEVVTLLPMRSQATPVVHRSTSDMATLTFMIHDAAPERRYHVQIASQNGQVVFTDDAFGPFSEYGTAHLLLNVRDLSDGDYRLSVSGGEQPVQEFVFHIAP